MEDLPPSHEDSLKIINQMIETARRQVNDNGFHLLWWGWITILGALGHYALLQYTDFHQPYLAWLITIPGALVSFIYGYRRSKVTKATRGYTDQIIVWVWVGLIISVVVLEVFLPKYNFQIVPLILLLIANATFITGWILRFRPVIFGGAIFWAWAVAAFALPPDQQLLVMVGAIITGYIIPGYTLRSHYRKQ